jgi:hypothetical protein
LISQVDSYVPAKVVPSITWFAQAAKAKATSLGSLIQPSARTNHHNSFACNAHLYTAVN